MVIRHSAQGATGGGLLEEHTEQGNQCSCDHSRDQVFLVDHDAAVKSRLHQQQRFFGHAHVNFVDVAAEDGLTHAVQEVGNTQGRHQQGRAFLVDQVTQHQVFNHPSHDEHHRRSASEGQQVDEHKVGDAKVHRDPFAKAGHGQRSKQHHRTLREVKHARGFVNQHEAEGHQRIQHACHEAAEEGFKKKSHGLVLSVKCRGKR